MSPVLKSQNFLSSLSQSSHFGRVLDHLPGISFFAKNLEFEIVAANEQFWQRLNVASEQELLGKTDFELFPEALASRFRADDEKVISTQEPLLQQVELFFNLQGLPDWYLTNKLPVFGRDGGVVGVMGTSRACARPGGKHTLHPSLDKALHLIRENFRNAISVEALATHSGLSLRQFNRLFKEMLGMNPQTFIIKTRVQAACELLRNSNDGIGDIALDLGFCDQSALTQHFRKHMGTTPLQYRKRSGSGVAAVEG